MVKRLTPPRTDPRSSSATASPRNDLPRMIARLTTVIIEVKWSDNPDMAIGLAEQLGGKYLIGEQKTHGIYLVGGSGGWPRRECARIRLLQAVQCGGRAALQIRQSEPLRPRVQHLPGPRGVD